MPKRWRRANPTDHARGLIPSKTRPHKKVNHGGRDEFGSSVNGTAGRHDQHAREIMTARLRFARTDAARATRSHRFKPNASSPTLQTVPLERPRLGRIPGDFPKWTPW